MPTLYLDDQQSSIRISGQEFVITTGEQERERIPRTWVERIIIAGNVQITTQAMTALLKDAIPVAFMSTRGNYRGSLQPMTHKHAALRMQQYERFQDDDFRLKLSVCILTAKLKNSRNTLLKHHRSHHDFHCDMEAEGIALEIHKMKTCPSVEGLMGHEGVAAHWYFMAFGRMVRREFAFETRSRRPPKDPVNAMLSLGYTLLYNECRSAIEAIGLDPNVGFIHAIEYGRASLASDMVEEFRWLIDGMVLGLVNRNIINREDFEEQENGGFLMADHARKKYYQHYETRINEEVKYREIHISYRRIFIHQAEHLARFLQGEENEYRPFMNQ